MANASHILETALLLLAAFLIGCVAGYLLRRLAAGRLKPALAQSVAQPPAAVMAAPLVVAPVIGPIAAPAPRPVAAPPQATIQPAHVAGQATSGRIIPTPVSKPEAPEPVPAAPIEISWSELSGRPAAPEHRRLREDEAEDAAMRAVEGGWTPPPAPRSAPRHIELPEPIDVGELQAHMEAAAPVAEDTSPAEIAGALSAVRSGVAAASTAAAAAIAGHRSIPASAMPSASPASAAPAPTVPRTPFGKPDALAAPRQGRKDDLQRIKGITFQIEAALNERGIFHFDQIAEWDRKAVVWMDGHLALKGRIAREKWIEQAREMAKGRVFAPAAKP